MSTDAKLNERPSLALTAGVLLSTAGVVLMSLLCCGVPVLLIAAGVAGAAGAALGGSWMPMTAGIAAAGFLLWVLRRRSTSSTKTTGDCCTPDINQGPSSRADASLAPMAPVAPATSAGGSGT
jgi:membrane protein implicated in regulation of membrane protease activity